jgi:hypothetical protein
MKKILPACLVLAAVLLTGSGSGPAEPPLPGTDQYIVIAWNDLGMHCANLDFANMCILPPYNTQMAHVIRIGDPTRPPLVVNGTSGIYVTYEIPGNTWSAGKTNFWNYTQHLFGITLAPNIGMTGNGMTGTMIRNDTLNYQVVTGIPNTAFPDATPALAYPYQLTLTRAWSPAGALLASTQSVIPVSHEINCVSSGCHASELAILQKHDAVPGFNIADRPILCANCHSDHALGMPGQPGVPSFSQAIHEKHGGFIKTNTNADCYKCHPGPNTQCWRDVMHTTTGMITKCQDCHGSVEWVGHSIDEGREPWLEEPSCGSPGCHGPQYAENPGKLFRESKGHGGLFCSTCHGSPHAILPTTQAGDNLQNILLQGFQGTLSECTVCHGYTPAGNGPHGVPALKAVQNVTVGSSQSTCYNATQVITVAGDGTWFSVASGGNATMIAGRKISFLPGTSVSPGGHLRGYITVTGRYCNNPLPPLAPQPSMDGGTMPALTNAARGTRIFPNPFTDLISVEIPLINENREISVSIFSATGRLVTCERHRVSGTISIDVSDLPRGIYLVRITGETEPAVFKMLKQ